MKSLKTIAHMIIASLTVYIIILFVDNSFSEKLLFVDMIKQTKTKITMLIWLGFVVFLFLLNNYPYIIQKVKNHNAKKHAPIILLKKAQKKKSKKAIKNLSTNEKQILQKYFIEPDKLSVIFDKSFADKNIINDLCKKGILHESFNEDNFTEPIFNINKWVKTYTKTHPKTIKIKDE